MAIIGSPAIAPSRTPLIHALQWVSMDSAALFFAVENIAGGTHLTVPYLAALVTAAFETALLWADRRNQTRRNAIEAPNTPTPGEESQTLPQPVLLSIACTKWAIGLRALIALAWTWASVSEIMRQVFIRVPSGYLIFKIIWIAGQLGVVVTLTALCAKEQKQAVRI